MFISNQNYIHRYHILTFLGIYGEWGAWGSCTAQNGCGEAYMERTRECVIGSDCSGTGASTESQSCQIECGELSQFHGSQLRS